MKIVNRKITELIEADYNPRRLTETQYKQLKNSLSTFGLVDPILVNINQERKNIIIGGHQRAKVWSDLGNDTIPCVELDLSLDQEKELNVRLNKNTGEFDFDMLANHFDEDKLLYFGFEQSDFGKDMFLEEPDSDQLIEEDLKDNKIQMTITFLSIQDLQNAEFDIKELIDKKYKGSYFSVKGGEI